MDSSSAERTHEQTSCLVGTRAGRDPRRNGAVRLRVARRNDCMDRARCLGQPGGASGARRQTRVAGGPPFGANRLTSRARCRDECAVGPDQRAARPDPVPPRGTDRRTTHIGVCAMTRFFTWAGGRKVGLGLIAAVLLTAMAFALDAAFTEYAGGILLALGFSQATVAYEDTRRQS